MKQIAALRSDLHPNGFALFFYFISDVQVVWQWIEDQGYDSCSEDEDCGSGDDKRYCSEDSGCEEIINLPSI